MMFLGLRIYILGVKVATTRLHNINKIPFLKNLLHHKMYFLIDVASSS